MNLPDQRSISCDSDGDELQEKMLCIIKKNSQLPARLYTLKLTFSNVTVCIGVGSNHKVGGTVLGDSCYGLMRHACDARMRIIACKRKKPRKSGGSMAPQTPRVRRLWYVVYIHIICACLTTRWCSILIY